MDRYDLNVVNLSCICLKEQFDKVADPDRLTTIYQTGDVNSCQCYEQADVIFLSYSQACDSIETVVANKPSYATIVLLSDGSIGSSVESFNEQLLDYDVWETGSVIVLHHLKALKIQMLQKLDLELTSNQLDTLIDSVPDLIWYKDFKGSHIKVNKSFCKTVNKTKEQIKYRGHCYIWDLNPEEYEQGEYVCMETEEVVLEEQKTFLFDEKVKISDEMRQLKTYKTAIVGRHGESLGTVGIARDVTEIWNTHEEFRILISRLPFPMIILDKDYKLLSSNSHFEKLFNFSESNHDLFELKAFGEKYFDHDITLKEFHNTSVQKQMFSNNDICHYIIEKSEITDVFGEISGYFYIFRDVTEVRKYEEYLQILAQTDELTQINNRKAINTFFDIKLPVLVNLELSFSLALIDIDYFKQYNDTYGHLEGDIIIKEIASILNSQSDTCLNNEVFVGRYGGEEFILMLINKTKNQVQTLIDTITSTLKEKQIPHSSSQVDTVLTMSIGITHSEKLTPATQLNEIIEKADKALYQAKNTGRNRCIFQLCYS